MRTCTYGIFNFPDFEACGKFTAVKLLNAEMLFRKAIQNALVGLHRRSVWAIAHLFIAQEIGVGSCIFIYCTGDRCGLFRCKKQRCEGAVLHAALSSRSL